MIIGLTGGIGCGKSEVARILRERGLKVISADDIVHELLREAWVKAKLRELFGDCIFDDRGEVNRKSLAGIVFKDDSKLSSLNSLLHPLVRERIKVEIERARKANDDLVVEIPLLFEAGGAYDVDLVVVVTASLDVVVERLRKSRGWSEEEIRDRMSKQLPLEEKERLADYVIYNDGDLKELERKVDLLLSKLKLRSKEDDHSDDRC